jgi:integrase
MPIWKRRRAKRDVWIVDYRDAAGERHRVTANTRQEAVDLEADKNHERRDPSSLAMATDITLDEYAERWLMAAAAELKPRTIQSYRQLFKIHLSPIFGARKLREITRSHVKQLIAKKREVSSDKKQLSKNTVRLIRACLSSMLGEAVDDGLIKANPAAFASRRRGTKRADALTLPERQKTIRPMNEAELESFLAECEVHAGELYPLFLTLARTGMRPGECFALKWEDLDFTKREVLVERALSAGEVGTTKTAQARRVDLSQTLAQTLSQLYIEREKEKLKGMWQEIPDWIFVNHAGHLMDESRVRKRFAIVLRKAKLSGHRVYDLRHTFATLLLAKGAPITYVAAQLGHSKPTTTLQWYAHWLPRSDKGFIDSLDRSGSDVWHQSGANLDFARPEVSQVPDFIGGPLETRTPDPLIKSLQN